MSQFNQATIKRFERLAAIFVCSALLVACEGKEEPTTLTREQLMDPETCKSCHPTAYREWKASMHAYAAEDPVFRAMNELGQEETGGELGDFCVKCHAPMAVAEGATTDGLNLDEVPEHLQGVTCYFCHNAVDVIGDHNAEIVLANDTTMRGGLIDPVRPSAHGVAFSRFQDRFNPESNRMCGGCHDIVTPNGVHLERTFKEYQESLFASGPGFTSCVSCHMPFRDGVAANDPDRAVPQRKVHSHLWPGVDVAITPWPDREIYQDAVQCALDNAISLVEVQASPLGLTVSYEADAGHKMPSGASQDRRLWVEMVAYDADDNVICSVGAVPDGVAVATFVDPQPCDVTDGPWLFRDQVFDENGEETHMFWRVAPSEMYPTGIVDVAMPFALPGPAEEVPRHSITVGYSVFPPPARMTVRMRMRPMDIDTLQELIDREYLDEAILDEFPTFTLASTVAEVRFEGSEPIVSYDDDFVTNCYDAYFCAFEPDAPRCD